MMVVMGDLKDKNGHENAGLERGIRKHGSGKMNENGEPLVDFCLDFYLVIVGTLFQHKVIHKFWYINTGEPKLFLSSFKENNRFIRIISRLVLQVMICFNLLFVHDVVGCGIFPLAC